MYRDPEFGAWDSRMLVRWVHETNFRVDHRIGSCCHNSLVGRAQAFCSSCKMFTEKESVFCNDVLVGWALKCAMLLSLYISLWHQGSSHSEDALVLMSIWWVSVHLTIGIWLKDDVVINGSSHSEDALVLMSIWSNDGFHTILDGGNAWICKLPT